MIKVSNLTKYYGDYAAIRNVSFEVPAGEIVGFLGPNGAGKSTTMRILVGYMTATSGKAAIDGHDVFWEPVEARKRIGYMPENCPLYPEMRVSEYLQFRAGIKGVHGRPRRQRVDYVIGKCWLGDVKRQLIGTLSKGYRQRVGLADALLADPPVLILDEPTAGLDPTQIRATRDLIKELGKQHTILLSTHILSEVEKLECDRVIIIHQGQVAASNTLSELGRKAGEQSSIVAEFEGIVDSTAIEKLAGVTHVRSQKSSSSTRVTITTSDEKTLQGKLFNLTVEKGWKLRELRPQRQTLEDVFVRIVEQDDTVRDVVTAS